MEKQNQLIKDDQKKGYCAGYLLHLILTEEKKYSVLLEGDDQYLESLFVFMIAKEFIEISPNNFYEVTEKGKEKYQNYKDKYQEYLAHFDIYSAVDLESGEFAFEKFFQLDDDAWEAHVSQERFEDLRIAVAKFKKMNAEEIVFLSFINEGQFHSEDAGWQFDLMSGLAWSKIEDIVENSLDEKDLAYTSEDGEGVDGGDVLVDVIKQGAELCQKLYDEEQEIKQDEGDDFNDPEEHQEVITVYESYYDPFYVSPMWLLF